MAIGSNYFLGGPQANQVFGDVLPFDQAWGAILPLISEAIQYNVDPEIQRQFGQAQRGLTANLAATGGGAFSSGIAQMGALEADSMRRKNELSKLFEDQYRQGFESLWYNPTQDAYNKALTQGKTPSQLSDMLNIPSLGNVLGDSGVGGGINFGMSKRYNPNAGGQYYTQPNLSYQYGI